MLSEARTTVAPQQDDPTWQLLTVDDRDYVSMENIRKFYKFTDLRRSGPAAALAVKKMALKVEADSREIWINNVKFISSFPVLEQGGELWISRMDLVKLIHPVLNPSANKNATDVKTVVLDAAHGGDEPGRLSGAGPEKDFTLDLVKRTRSLLEAAGFSVVLTRETDRTIPVAERVRMANQAENAVLISVNFSSGNSGIETRALPPMGVPSTGHLPAESDMNPLAGNSCDAGNAALAAAVHASIVWKVRLYNRGIRRTRLELLNGLTIPGIVVSCGALDNAYDARDIARPEYRQLVAERLAEGVKNYQRAMARRPQNPEPAEATRPDAPVQPESIPADDKESE